MRSHSRRKTTAKSRQAREQAGARAGPAVRIRSLRRADVSLCAAIVSREPLWRRYGVTKVRAARLLHRALRRRDPLLVAHVGGRVAGFVWFYLDGTFAHSGYVRWIAVAPEMRGSRLGAALMRAVEDRIFRRGRDVFLLVSDFNRGAQRFYRRLGYRKVGALRDYVVAGVTEYVYRKVRSPQGGAV